MGYNNDCQWRKVEDSGRKWREITISFYHDLFPNDGRGEGEDRV